jgi:hypothetical protein
MPGPAGSGLWTPSRSGGLIITPLNINSAGVDNTTYTIPLNSVQGNIAVLLAPRVNNTTVRISGVTYAGAALTNAQTTDSIGSGSLTGWTGYKRAGATGINNLVITATVNSMRRLAGYFIDMDTMNASPLGGNPAMNNDFTTGKQSNSIAITNTTLQSIMLAMIAVPNDNAWPLYCNTGGFGMVHRQKTGTGGTADVSCILGIQRPSTIGAKTFTATDVGSAPVNTVGWLGMAMELLPV